MNHVVVNIQPFLAKQEVNVYQDNECVQSAQCNIKELPQVCYRLCKEFNINQLDVTGFPAFTQKLKNSITSSQFEDFKINVNII